MANDTQLSGTTTPTVDSLAYDNQFAGAAETTLYGLNAGLNALARIGGPAGTPSANSGVVTNIGPVGFTLLGTATALDFAPNGTLFAAFGFQGTGYSLYTVDTTTGVATLVGVIGSGAPVDGLAVANAGLSISPPSGTYTSQQRFDMVLLLNAQRDGLDHARCAAVLNTRPEHTRHKCADEPNTGKSRHELSACRVQNRHKRQLLSRAP